MRRSTNALVSLGLLLWVGTPCAAQPTETAGQDGAACQPTERFLLVRRPFHFSHQPHHYGEQIDRLDQRIGEVDRDLVVANDRMAVLLARHLETKHAELAARREVEQVRNDTVQLQRVEARLVSRLTAQFAGSEKIAAAQQSLDEARRLYRRIKTELLESHMNQPGYGSVLHQISLARAKFGASASAEDTTPQRTALARSILSLKDTLADIEQEILAGSAAYTKALEEQDEASELVAAIRQRHDLLIRTHPDRIDVRSRHKQRSADLVDGKQRLRAAKGQWAVAREHHRLAAGDAARLKDRRSRLERDRRRLSRRQGRLGSGFGHLVLVRIVEPCPVE